MDAAYDHSNRAFLQAFMARSFMTFKEAQPVLAAILTVSEGQTVDPEDVTEEQFSSYVSAANTAISPFDFEIRSSLLQTPPTTTPEDAPSLPDRVYALVNTTSDPLTQLATTYSADEIAFLKRLLDYMFINNNTVRCEGLAATQMQAVQLHRAGDTSRRQSQAAGTQQTQAGAPQSLRMTQAETMIKNLIEEGWLQKSLKGYLSLTPRALMELRGWLVSEYNDETREGHRAHRIKFCAACKDIITVGQRCGDLECGGRLHEHCMRNFFRMQKGENCPVCKEGWPGDHYVGERAFAARAQPRSIAQPDSQVPYSSMPNGDEEEESDEENSDEDG
ncbi:uncharacterized protein N7511_002963 [Penicillium nucicola]|uniref:uncharacterized protein n=1 Tax=Penicillium nucicola TaxID=1850975 RepID=UPI0025453D57|nr:uncharacterized protein N7511_002963 [Penicillium nucicola]KAJ5770912.1 hypothetical protein N7511_002963 [Penicillium nucicola]